MDWSYSTCKQLSILKYDPSQTPITDYYKIIDEVERYVRTSPKLMNMFNVSPTDSNQALHYSYKKDVCTFSKKTVDNAEKNTAKFPQSRRHDEVIKKLLHLYCFMVVLWHTSSFTKIWKLLFHP